VDDDLVVSLLNEAIAAQGGGYLLDGFPRTLAQAQRADAPPVDLVIHLDLPDDVARTRLAQRADGRRADDTRSEVTERRLRLFNSETEPVLDFSRRRGILRTVDANRPPDVVALAVLRSLGTADSSSSA
jgi:adenylate kinase